MDGGGGDNGKNKTTEITGIAITWHLNVRRTEFNLIFIGSVRHALAASAVPAQQQNSILAVLMGEVRDHRLHRYLAISCVTWNCNASIIIMHAKAYCATAKCQMASFSRISFNQN